VGVYEYLADVRSLCGSAQTKPNEAHKLTQIEAVREALTK